MNTADYMLLQGIAYTTEGAGPSKRRGSLAGLLSAALIGISLVLTALAMIAVAASV